MIKQGWLVSAHGINFVAFGLAATAMSVLWFVYKDVWFLLAGDLRVYRDW